MDTDPRKDTYLYFKAMVLTPTTSKQYVRNIMNSKAKVRTLDKIHSIDRDEDENAMFMNCDKAEYVNAHKVYIFCWRQLTAFEVSLDPNRPLDKATGKLREGMISLRIFLKIYNPLKHNGEELEVVSDTTYYMLKDPKKPLKKIRTLLSFNGEFSSTTLAIWSSDGEIMMIFKILEDKLHGLIFPHEKQALEDFDFRLKVNSDVKNPRAKGLVPADQKKIDWKNLNVEVSTLHEVKIYSYLIQSNIKVEGKDKHFLYYLDLSASKAKFVTEGLYQNVETKDPGNGMIER